MESSIGQRLKELLNDSKMKQKVLADKLNIHPSAITQYLKGTSKPEMSNILLMSEIFEARIEWLLTGSGEKYRNTKLSKQLIHNTNENSNESFPDTKALIPPEYQIMLLQSKIEGLEKELTAKDQLIESLRQQIQTSKS